jgi:hypothetical protein
MTSSFSFDQKVCVPAHVATRDLDGELVVLNFDSETYFGLDAVGARMWEVLSTSPSIEAGVQQLLTEFDVDDARLRTDVAALLGKMVDGGLVELQPV